MPCLQAVEMIRNIRAELIKILDESDWMDDETKIVAKEKVTIKTVDKVKVKFSHTRYRALGPELIPVYRQSARR